MKGYTTKGGDRRAYCTGASACMAPAGKGASSARGCFHPGKSICKTRQGVSSAQGCFCVDSRGTEMGGGAFCARGRCSRPPTTYGGRGEGAALQGKGSMSAEEHLRGDCSGEPGRQFPCVQRAGSLPRDARPCCSWSASCAGEGCWSILKFPWASSVRGRLHSACAAGPAKMPAAEGQRRGRRVPARSARKSSA